MNTPAHAVVNVVALGHGRWAHEKLVIGIGAVLPDLPMFVFYGYHKWVGTPERVIWSQSYFEPGWQALIDLFNSLPLIGILFIAGTVAKRTWLQALSASMALHGVCDLLLHHDDAHRHFFPLSDWRFESPISYWDPRHYGHIFSVFELALVLGGAAFLIYVSRGSQTRGLRHFSVAVLALYFSYIGYAIVTWAS